MHNSWVLGELFGEWERCAKEESEFFASNTKGRILEDAAFCVINQLTGFYSRTNVSISLS